MQRLRQCGKRTVARRLWTAALCGGRCSGRCSVQQRMLRLAALQGALRVVALQQGMLRLAALQAALRVLALQQGMLWLAAVQGSLRQLALQTIGARGVRGPGPCDALQGRTVQSMVAATGACCAVEAMECTRGRAPNACGSMQPLLEVWC